MYDTEKDLRGQLSWRPASESPLPWRVGDPATDEAITIPGDPQLKTEAEANVERESLLAKNLNPWILSIKLQDDGNNLHARAYLDNPPVGQEGRGVATLPKVVRDAIHALPNNIGGGAVSFETRPPPAIRAKELVQQITDSLSRRP